MDLQTCHAICKRFCSDDYQKQQEQFTNQCIKNKRPSSKLQVNILPIPTKNVYSFKLDELRSFDQSDKKMRKTFCGQSSHQLQRKQIVKIVAQRYRSPPIINRVYSPLVKQEKQYPMPIYTQTTDKKQLKEMVSPRLSHKSPKITFNFNAPSIQNGRMVNKRVKTVQEQTQYSSKHSQVFLKTNGQMIDNPSMQKIAKSKNHVVFKQPSQSSKNTNQIESLRTISQCIPSSQQQSFSPIQLQYYNNGVTFQSIMTSTQIKSRHSSKFSGQLKLLKSNNKKESSKLNLNLTFQNPQQLNSSNNDSPKVCFSPRQQQEIDPTMFYEAGKAKLSPRISVLSLSKHNQHHQNDQQEQLRDVIDHNFLISQQCSKNNSPKVSINPSLKNVSQNENSQKRNEVGVHSRDNSWQFGPLMSTHAKMKRTNTIQSFQTFSSEMISCLDIKFMQKNKGRRGVSRLI